MEQGLEVGASPGLTACGGYAGWRNDEEAGAEATRKPAVTEGKASKGERA